MGKNKLPEPEDKHEIAQQLGEIEFEDELLDIELKKAKIALEKQNLQELHSAANSSKDTSTRTSTTTTPSKRPTTQALA